MEISKKIKLELPHHIKHALSNINNFRKEVDLIISVSDARSLKATNVYKELLNIFTGVKILHLISKSDLSDSHLPNAFNFKIQKNRKAILKLINNALKEEMDKYGNQGYMPHFQILVIGLPNVGKSTLINLLKNKKVSISENRPGITRKIVKYSLGNNLWLYDSPGIFMHCNATPELVDKLFLINSIPTQINNYSELLNRAYLYLSQHYPDLLRSMVVDDFSSYPEFIISLSKKYNFKVKDGEWDYEKAESKFLTLLRTVKISWDRE